MSLASQGISCAALRFANGKGEETATGQDDCDSQRGSIRKDLENKSLPGAGIYLTKQNSHGSGATQSYHEAGHEALLLGKGSQSHSCLHYPKQIIPHQCSGSKIKEEDKMGEKWVTGRNLV